MGRGLQRAWTADGALAGRVKSLAARHRQRQQAFVLGVCLQNCFSKPVLSGHVNDQIKVTIETKTLGASLSWSDDLNVPPTHTGPHIINGPKGDALTVYGRTLRAMAFKTGSTNSSTAQGTYVGQ